MSFLGRILGANGPIGVAGVNGEPSHKIEDERFTDGYLIKREGKTYTIKSKNGSKYLELTSLDTMGLDLYRYNARIMIQNKIKLFKNGNI